MLKLILQSMSNRATPKVLILGGIKFGLDFLTLKITSN